MENTNNFEFKLVDGTYSKVYTIDVNSTMEHFLTTIKQQIEDECSYDIEAEIIEAGQYFNQNGRNPEEAPQLIASDILFRDYFGKRISTTSFYVRVRRNN